MIRALRKAPALFRLAFGLALACLALVGTGNSTGAVFCIGQDGHQGIEFALNGDCNASYGVGSSEAPLGLGMSDGHHCGPCIDIPIGLNTAMTPKSDESKSLAKAASSSPPAIVSYFNSVVDSASVSAKYRPFCPPRGSKAFLGLRTVVLLV